MEFFKSLKPSDICFDLLEVDVDEVISREKEAYTEWINNVLQRCGSTYRVEDLYNDIRNGIVISHIIYAFTGVKINLTSEKFLHNKPVMLLNLLMVVQALKRDGLHLENSNILDIYDGKPNIVLGLIWQIILHYDIRRGGIENYYNLPIITGHSLTSPVSDDSVECLRTKKSLANKFKNAVIGPVISITKIKELVKSFCENGHCNKVVFPWLKKEICIPYGINISNFTSDWRDGIAFMALVHRFCPTLINMDEVRKSSPRSNILQAFKYASAYLGIKITLDVDDILSGNVKENAVVFYIWQFMRLNAKRSRKNSKFNDKLHERKGSLSSSSSYATTPDIYSTNKECFTFKEEVFLDQSLYVSEDK